MNAAVAPRSGPGGAEVPTLDSLHPEGGVDAQEALQDLSGPFAGNPQQYEDVEAEMVAYLRQFMPEEVPYNRRRAIIRARLARQKEVIYEGYKRQLLCLPASYGYRFLPEYAEELRRLEEERRTQMAALDRTQAAALAQVDAEEEAERARLRAIPYWPYGEEDTIGDGTRQQGHGPGGGGPGYPRQPRPVRGAGR